MRTPNRSARGLSEQRFTTSAALAGSCTGACGSGIFAPKVSTEAGSGKPQVQQNSPESPVGRSDSMRSDSSSWRAIHWPRLVVSGHRQCSPLSISLACECVPFALTATMAHVLPCQDLFGSYSEPEGGALGRIDARRGSSRSVCTSTRL